MKIKRDFVTNSSSTSFTIASKMYGKVPSIFCCRGLIGSLKKHGNIVDMYKASSKIYARFSVEFLYENFLKHEYRDLALTCSAEVMLLVEDFSGVDPDCKSEKFCILRVETKTGESSSYNNVTKKQSLNYLCSMKILEELLNQAELKKENQFGRVVYTQYVVELIGSGIDGGDPQGDYPFSLDILSNESIVEDILIKKGNVVKRERV